jgi:hypothetical protein
MGRRDISRENMYESVKTLVECEQAHIHLPQQKLFTLFSIGFNYLLYLSTKKPGHYIFRIQDSYLAEKLARKAKDDTTRKFMYRLLLPRRLKYGNSTFHLDFFNLNTWNVTKDLPKDRIMAALIVKNTSAAPIDSDVFIEEDEEEKMTISDFPEDYYLTSLTDFVPRTVTIAFDDRFDGLHSVKFPFIKEATEVAQGVKIAADVDINDLD